MTCIDLHLQIVRYSSTSSELHSSTIYMYLLYGHELTHVFNEHNLKKKTFHLLCAFTVQIIICFHSWDKEADTWESSFSRLVCAAQGFCKSLTSYNFKALRTQSVQSQVAFFAQRNIIFTNITVSLGGKAHENSLTDHIRATEGRAFLWELIDFPLKAWNKAPLNNCFVQHEVELAVCK